MADIKMRIKMKIISIKIRRYVRPKSLKIYIYTENVSSC